MLATVAILVWQQKKAQEYEEAFKKGQNAWKERQADKAVAEWRKAALNDPRDPELWVMIGRAELFGGRPEKALQAWEEALKREPGYKPAIFERGKEEIGRHIARRIGPPVDRSGWMPLGLSAPGGDDARMTLAELKEASQHGPMFTKFVRGLIYLLDGKYREAHPPLQEYAEANDWDATAIALQGIAGHYAALSTRAEKALTDALALRSDKAWRQVRAAARFLQGNLDGARADYRDAGAETEAEPLFTRRIPSQGLILWLRADAGIEASGNVLTRWKDQSGRGNDGVPKEGAVGPQVVASAVRGKPAVQFAGDEGLYLPDGFEDFGAGLSLFVVGEPMMDPAESWSFVFLATAARGAGRIEALLGKRRESDQVVYAAEDLQSQVKPYVAGVPPARAFDSISALHEPSGTARLYRRGAPVAHQALILPRKTLRTRNRVGAGLKGRLAEALLYDRALAELERLGVEAWLNGRYFPPEPAEKR